MGVFAPQLDPQDALMLRQTISDNLSDVLWKKLFYWFTFFESLDGYSLQGNAPTLNSNGVTLATAASLNSTSFLTKSPTDQTIFNFNRSSRFRVGLEFGAASFTASTAYITLGTFGIGDNYYGFEVINGVLKGSCSNANTTSSNAITLKTLTSATTYELEARYITQNQIQFFVDDVLLGVLRSEFPSGAFATLVDLYIKTTNGDAKTLIVAYCEILQERNSPYG